VGDGVQKLEANKKEPQEAWFWRRCRGQRAWHVRRDAQKNLGDPPASPRVGVEAYNQKKALRRLNGSQITS